ncbi:MAG: hypothetical protein U0804_04605 [Gemmataceae bacterium]
MTPRRWLLLVPAVPVVLLVAVALAGDWVLGVRVVRPEPPAEPPPPAAAPDAAPDPAVVQTLEAITTAARTDPAAAVALLDVERFHAAVARSDTFRAAGVAADPVGGPVRARFALAAAVRAGGLAFAPASVEVRRVGPGVEADELVVAARHRGGGRAATYRWWLVRSAGGWKAFDLEDVRTGVRLSRQAAGQLGRDGLSADVKAGLAALGPAAEKLGAGDAAGAAAALAPARAAALPRDGYAVRCLIEGGVAAMTGNAAEARVWADRATAAVPGMPAADYLRASAAAAAGDWPAVLEPARAYLDAVGPDAPAARLLGTALRELGRPAAAAAAFEAGLRDDPGRADLRAARDQARALAAGR